MSCTEPWSEHLRMDWNTDYIPGLLAGLQCLSSLMLFWLKGQIPLAMAQNLEENRGGGGTSGNIVYVAPHMTVKLLTKDTLQFISYSEHWQNPTHFFLTLQSCFLKIDSLDAIVTSSKELSSSLLWVDGYSVYHPGLHLFVQKMDSVVSTVITVIFSLFVFCPKAFNFSSAWELGLTVSLLCHGLRNISHRQCGSGNFFFFFFFNCCLHQPIGKTHLPHLSFKH